MPIYEYQCTRCGHHLEALQKISDKPLRECPECGRHTLKRLMSAPLFRLAGSGWYETDFKSDKENKRNLVEKGEPEPARAEAKPDAGDAAKAEKKPEAKTEGKTETGASKARTPVARPPAKTAPRAKARAPARKTRSARARKR
jgi:putative FmdB family regulatory protein